MLANFKLLFYSKLVDRIDQNKDGKVTETELREWIKVTSKRYIYDDVDRQWSHLKKVELSSLSLAEIHDEGKTVDQEAPISWEKYKNITYGYITGNNMNNRKLCLFVQSRLEWTSIKCVVL